MGGNAFPTPAARLTCAQHTALLTYVRQRLGHVFTSLESPRYVSSKTSHGDLDVLCGWPGVGYVLKGGGSGTIDAGKTYPLDLTVTADSPSKVINAWSAGLAAALGGTMWVRSGAEVSVAVPVSVLDEEVHFAGTAAPPPTPIDTPGGTGTATTPTLEQEQEQFFQVDLMFNPPHAMPFAEFAYSYGTVVLVLCHMLRRATVHGATVQTGCVILRTRPYATLRAMDVVLSADPRAVCEWLGLDYDAWLAAEYDTLDELFAWFANTPKDSLADVALNRIVRTSRDYSRNDRMIVVDQFTDWLQKSGYGGYVAPEAEMEEEPAESQSQPQSPKHKKGKKKQAPPAPLAPEAPTPLTDTEVAILTHWGLMDEYVAQLEVLRSEARTQVAAMQRNRERREEERLGREAEERMVREESERVDRELQRVEREVEREEQREGEREGEKKEETEADKDATTNQAERAPAPDRVTADQQAQFESTALATTMEQKLSIEKSEVEGDPQPTATPPQATQPPATTATEISPYETKPPPTESTKPELPAPERTAAEVIPLTSESLANKVRALNAQEAGAKEADKLDEAGSPKIRVGEIADPDKSHVSAAVPVPASVPAPEVSGTGAEEPAADEDGNASMSGIESTSLASIQAVHEPSSDEADISALASSVSTPSCTSPPPTSPSAGAEPSHAVVAPAAESRTAIPPSIDSSLVTKDEAFPSPRAFNYADDPRSASPTSSSTPSEAGPPFLPDPADALNPVPEPQRYPPAPPTAARTITAHGDDEPVDTDELLADLSADVPPRDLSPVSELDEDGDSEEEHCATGSGAASAEPAHSPASQSQSLPLSRSHSQSHSLAPSQSQSHTPDSASVGTLPNDEPTTKRGKVKGKKGHGHGKKESCVIV